MFSFASLQGKLHPAVGGEWPWCPDSVAERRLDLVCRLLPHHSPQGKLTTAASGEWQ